MYFGHLPALIFISVIAIISSILRAFILKKIRSSEAPPGNPLPNPWRCTCGRRNSDYVRVCACGREKDSAPPAPAPKTWRCTCGKKNSEYVIVCGCGRVKSTRTYKFYLLWGLIMVVIGAIFACIGKYIVYII